MATIEVKNPSYHSNSRTTFKVDHKCISTLRICNIQQTPADPGDNTRFFHPVYGAYKMMKNISLYFGSTSVSKVDMPALVGGMNNMDGMNEDQYLNRALYGCSMACQTMPTFLTNGTANQNFLTIRKSLGLVAALPAVNCSATGSVDLGVLFPILNGNYWVNCDQLNGIRVEIEWQPLTVAVTNGNAADTIQPPVLVYNQIDYSDGLTLLGNEATFFKYETDSYAVNGGNGAVIAIQNNRIANFSNKYINEIATFNVSNDTMNSIVSGPKTSTNLSVNGNKICSTDRNTYARRMMTNLIHPKQFTPVWGNAANIYANTGTEAEPVYGKTSFSFVGTPFGANAAAIALCPGATNLEQSTYIERYPVKTKCSTVQATFMTEANPPLSFQKFYVASVGCKLMWDKEHLKYVVSYV